MEIPRRKPPGKKCKEDFIWGPSSSILKLIIGIFGTTGAIYLDYRGGRLQVL